MFDIRVDVIAPTLVCSIKSNPRSSREFLSKLRDYEQSQVSTWYRLTSAAFGEEPR
jgi:hypothetical protein